MSYFVGRRASLGIAREATRGTFVTPTYWLPYESLKIDDKAIVVDAGGAFAQIEDSMESFVTKKFAEGEIEAILDDKAIGVILSALVGSAPSSSGSTNYTHTFTLANSNQHTSLALMVQDPNSATAFALAMLDSFEISLFF